LKPTSENNKDAPGVVADTPQKVLRRSLRLMAKAARKGKLPDNVPQQSHRLLAESEQTKTRQDETENKKLRRSLRIAKATDIIFLQLP